MSQYFLSVFVASVIGVNLLWMPKNTIFWDI